MKSIHTKATFTRDIRYTREVLRQIERSIASGNWADVRDAANELAGTMATLSAFAEDNHEGIEDFGCKWAGEISEIRAKQVA